MDIFGGIVLVSAFLFVAIVYGLFALVKANLVFVICAALFYSIFYKWINTYIQKLWKKQIYRILIIITSSFFVIVLLLASIMSSMTRYSDKFYSPDKHYYAQIDETNGGATTSYISNVGITNARSILSHVGSLSAWSGDRKYVFGTLDSLDTIHPSWLNNRTLKITYSDCDAVNGIEGTPDKSWRDIKIIYECGDQNAN